MRSENIITRLRQKIVRWLESLKDFIASNYIYVFKKWPCKKAVYLMVGSESSGTTAIANLLFLDISNLRFLEEGDHQWVWDVYQNVYQKYKKICDYPKLQLFDAIKVPGFATIIQEFREEFPNSKVIYIVRDPRDFANSAIKTWKIHHINELSSVSWVKENWLDIKSSDSIERLALRWKAYITTAMASSGNIIFLRYEDFCADKISTIKRLAGEVGLPFNIKRVSALCNKQLCHRSVRAYEPSGPGGWEKGMLTSEHIKKIETICHDEMVKWGYLSD